MNVSRAAPSRFSALASKLHGGALRAGSSAGLQVPQGAHADPGRPGEFLLSQAGLTPQFAEYHRKRR